MTLWISQRGAAAVEFALVLPVLLLILLGIIECGRAYNVQISLTHAARETARYMAIHNDWGGAVDSGVAAAPSVDLGATAFQANPASCAADADIKVTVTYELETVTGVAEGMKFTGKAAMRCGG
ncbi:Flp pilus assembly protein TadG [Kocuria rosea]|uniref:TadE/TadG family type IV pilus assembly protein n=1 Tax=Kocuria rosea TaxID=1275 RepID=UPI000F71907D|nr:TadE/TadG family type IV pilus assembly protein [Kocuria rosea]VEH43957.1 Flp pilus assembly protein TadG [Kocuria rosea]